VFSLLPHLPVLFSLALFCLPASSFIRRTRLGLASIVITSVFQYAQETQHEKILRGLAVGIALTMFNRLEESDALVTSLSTDKEPVLRRSGMYTIAMAYCGTGNNQAIRKLLHVAVSISTELNISLNSGESSPS
jgi:hypothetical protein